MNGTMRLAMRNMSTIFTYDVLGRDPATLMNLQVNVEIEIGDLM